MSECGLPRTTPLGGGSRYVGRCGRLATDEVDGEAMCGDHANEARYRKRRFDEMMATASRHVRAVAYGVPGSKGAGVWCSCGTFVPAGEAHPFGVPAREEGLA